MKKKKSRFFLPKKSKSSNFTSRKSRKLQAKFKKIKLQNRNLYRYITLIKHA